MVSNWLFFNIFNLSHHIPILDQLMIFSAQYLIFILVLLAIYSIKHNLKNKQAILLSAVALGLSLILTELIRMFYFEPRPFLTFNFTPLIPQVADAAFPSEHTLAAFCLVWAYLVYKSRLFLSFLILACLVGFSRVFVGVHYPIDIFGGIIVAGISVYIIHHTHKLIRQYI